MITTSWTPLLGNLGGRNKRKLKVRVPPFSTIGFVGVDPEAERITEDSTARLQMEWQQTTTVGIWNHGPKENTSRSCLWSVWDKMAIIWIQSDGLVPEIRSRISEIMVGSEQSHILRFQSCMLRLWTYSWCIGLVFEPLELFV